MQSAFSLSTFELLVIGLLVIGTAKLVAIVHDQYTYWKRRKVPYVDSFPFFGSVWSVLLRRLNLREYCEYIYNYNQNVRYIGAMDFSTPIVILRDPELIKEVGVKSFEHFLDHRSFLSEDMDPVFGKNVFSLKGDRWKEMRNTLSPSFTTSKMKFMFNLVSKCSREFFDYLYEHPESCDMVEAKDVCTKYTNDVIASVAFGITVNSMKDPENEFRTRGKDAAAFTSLWRSIKFLMFRVTPSFSKLLGLRFLSRKTSAFFWNVILETVKAREEQGIVRPDMIHLLMQEKNSKKETAKKMDIDDIVAQGFIFFLAGFDTVSNLMSFVVYELSLHSDVQEKLREEVDRYSAEENGEISYETVMKMEYMEMVVSEVLRMHPPSLLTDRVCTEKFELPPAGPGYDSTTVYPGDNIIFPIYGLHRDPNYFPDPDTFNPERFSNENKDKINPYVFIPFGVGPRKCIGNRFALMETKILIANMLKTFIVKPNERTQIPLKFLKGNFTLVPEKGLWFTLEKRHG